MALLAIQTAFDVYSLVYTMYIIYIIMYTRYTIPVHYTLYIIHCILYLVSAMYLLLHKIISNNLIISQVNRIRIRI